MGRKHGPTPKPCTIFLEKMALTCPAQTASQWPQGVFHPNACFCREATTMSPITGPTCPRWPVASKISPCGKKIEKSGIWGAGSMKRVSQETVSSGKPASAAPTGRVRRLCGRRHLRLRVRFSADFVSLTPNSRHLSRNVRFPTDSVCFTPRCRPPC